VQNEPGVLSRVSGILAGRGFNIDSLVVCSTEIRDLSRMCIVLKGQEGVVEQARRQLEDLVPVWAVIDYTDTPKIQRELLLVKVSLLGPEYLEDQLVGGPHHDPRVTAQQAAATAEVQAATAQHEGKYDPVPDVLASSQEGASPAVTGEATPSGHMPEIAEQNMAEGQAGTDPSNPLSEASAPAPTPESSRAAYNSASQIAAAVHAAAQSHPQASASGHHHHPAPLTTSQALALRAQHMAAISGLASQFGGRLVDVSENSAIVELAAKTQRVDAFIRLLAPYGILESARSGMMTLPRSPVRPADDDEGFMEGSSIDASMLPPG
jgi:acetolactate synthase-1/3 small subunit